MTQRAFGLLEALVEEGSFRRAAERLGVTQPHVSQSLRRLEEKYGAMIVDRHASPLRLTPLGEVVYDSLRRMALIEVETLKQCADFKELRTGRVRVACNAERSISMLMPVAAAFARAYPKVELDLTLDLLLEDVPDALASGRADVGVLFQRLMTPDLNAYPLVEERYLLAVPDAPEYANVGVPFNDEGIYPKAASVDLTPIAGLPFLCPNNHQERKELLSRALGIPVHAMLVMALKPGLRLPFVAEGLCWTVCQEHLIRQHEPHRRCRFASLEDVLPVQTVVIAWDEHVYQSLAARAFCSMAVDMIGRGCTQP